MGCFLWVHTLIQASSPCSVYEIVCYFGPRYKGTPLYHHPTYRYVMIKVLIINDGNDDNDDNDDEDDAN